MFLWSGWRRIVLLDNPGSSEIRSRPAMRKFNIAIEGLDKTVHMYIKTNDKKKQYFQVVLTICKKNVIGSDNLKKESCMVIQKNKSEPV